MVNLIDTHTHLFAEEFDEDRELALIRATEAGVLRLLSDDWFSSYFCRCRLETQTGCR